MVNDNDNDFDKVKLLDLLLLKVLPNILPLSPL